MLINLLSAFLQDVLTVARTEDFFALSQKAREKQLETLADSRFPQALSRYLATVTSENLMADVRAPIHASHEFFSGIKPVQGEIGGRTEEERRGNGFVQAFSAALSHEVADAFDQETLAPGVFSPQASAVLEHLFATRRTVEVGREIQSFLDEQIGIASPIVQSPYPFSIAQKQEMRATLRERYPGSFPLFEVEPSLAGGLRVFYQGELLDESWMTHAAHALSVLREDRSSIH